MDLTNQPSRPPLKPTDVYRPRLGAQNPPRWKVAIAAAERAQVIAQQHEVLGLFGCDLQPVRMEGGRQAARFRSQGSRFDRTQDSKFTTR